MVAAGLLMFAGYSLGRAAGFEEARRGDVLEAPRKPPATQTIVLAVLGLAAGVGALLLQGERGVRMPTPARLEELAGRAEAEAVERAERAAP